MFAKFFSYHKYYIYIFHFITAAAAAKSLTKPKLFVYSGNDITIHYLQGHHWLHEYSVFLWGNYTKHTIILFIKM